MCFFLSGLWSFVSGCREQGTWCWFSRWHRNIRGDAIGAPKMCVHISFHKCLLSTYYVPGPAWSTGTTAANKTEKSIVLAFCTWCTGVFTLHSFAYSGRGCYGQWSYMWVLEPCLSSGFKLQPWNFWAVCPWARFSAPVPRLWNEG